MSLFLYSNPMDIRGAIAKFLKVNIAQKGVNSLSSGGDPFLVWLYEKKVSKQKAMQVYSGWVYASIKAISKEIAVTKFKLYELDSDGNRTEVFNHELLDILHAPNQFQTGYEMLYKIAAHLELVGNAYIYLDGVNDEKGKPTMMRLLDPKCVKPVKAPFPGFISHYEYRLDQQVHTFQPYEILHIKYPDPNDDIEGIGTVQSIAQWVDADNYATEFNRRYFLNGARIGGYLTSETALSSEQLDYLKKSFEAIYSGVENAYRVAALPKGTAFVEGQASQKDMDFVEGQRMSRDKIMAGSQIPKTVLGITEDVNRANAEASNYVFALRTVKPLVELISTFLNEFLVPRYGENLELGFANPVPEDRKLRIEEMQAATGGQQVMTVNEAREDYFGMEAVEGGDVIKAPMNMVDSGKVPSKTGKSAKGKRTVYKSRFARNQSNRKKISSEIAEKAAKVVKDFEANKTKMLAQARKDVTALSDKDYETLWKAFANRIAAYEKKMIEVIRKFNGEQKKTVLNNFAKSQKSIKKGIDLDSLMGKDQIGALVSLVDPVLTDLYQKEGAEAGALIGVDGMDILNDQTRKALDKAIELLSASYDETTRKILKDKLDQGMADGLSYQELADMIATIYDYSDDIRALQVARTETVRIGNDANKEAWKQTGVVKTVKWYAPNSEACSFCQELNGTVVGIDENFLNKGDEATGTDEEGNAISMTVDYSDVGAPPLHCNCYCYLRPEDISIN